MYELYEFCELVNMKQAWKSLKQVEQHRKQVADEWLWWWTSQLPTLNPKE
jgi:hypothetical protein